MFYAWLSLANKKLDEVEDKLEVDENFVKFFTTTTQASAKDAPVNLSLLDGEVISVNSSIFQDSIMSAKLVDPDWIKKHSIKCNNGKGFFKIWRW